MTRDSAHLVLSGDPIAYLRGFNQARGLLDAQTQVTQAAAEAHALADGNGKAAGGEVVCADLPLDNNWRYGWRLHCQTPAPRYDLLGHSAP